MTRSFVSKEDLRSTTRHLLSIGTLIFADRDIVALPKLTRLICKACFTRLKTLVSPIELTTWSGFQNLEGQYGMEGHLDSVL